MAPRAPRVAEAAARRPEARRPPPPGDGRRGRPNADARSCCFPAGWEGASRARVSSSAALARLSPSRPAAESPPPRSTREAGEGSAGRERAEAAYRAALEAKPGSRRAFLLSGGHGLETQVQGVSRALLSVGNDGPRPAALQSKEAAPSSVLQPTVVLNGNVQQRHPRDEIKRPRLPVAESQVFQARKGKSSFSCASRMFILFWLRWGLDDPNTVGLRSLKVTEAIQHIM